MRVLHVSETHTPAAGGVTKAVNQAAQNLVRRGHETAIITSRMDDPQVPEGIPRHRHVPSGFGRPWLWSPSLHHLSSVALSDPKPDVVHIHGCWMAPQFLAARLALSRRMPLVFSAHGFLEPWLWDGQGLGKAKKVAYWRLFMRRLLKRGSLIHAITPLEEKHLRVLLGEDCPVVVIPNGIEDRPSHPSRAEDVMEPVPGRVVFLGRIDPKKGLEMLLRALSVVRKENGTVQLLVAGAPRSPRYLKSVRDLATQLHLGEVVRFLGPVYGEEKWQLLESAWVLAVPSYSEVVGLVNLEAAIVRTPSLTTFQTGLWDWEEGGGVLVSPRSDELATALLSVLSWSRQERRERGRRSWQLARKKYSVSAVGDAWEAAYASLVPGD